MSRSTVHSGREHHLLHLVIYFFLYAPYDYVVLHMLQKSDMPLINTDMCLEEQSSYQIDWQKHLGFHFLLQHAVVTQVLETEGHSLDFSVFVGAFDMDSIADTPWRAEICLPSEHLHVMAASCDNTLEAAMDNRLPVFLFSNK